MVWVGFLPDEPDECNKGKSIENEWIPESFINWCHRYGYVWLFACRGGNFPAWLHASCKLRCIFLHVGLLRGQMLEYSHHEAIVWCSFTAWQPTCMCELKRAPEGCGVYTKDEIGSCEKHKAHSYSLISCCHYSLIPFSTCTGAPEFAVEPLSQVVPSYAP